MYQKAVSGELNLWLQHCRLLWVGLCAIRNASQSPKSVLKEISRATWGSSVGYTGNIQQLPRVCCLSWFEWLCSDPWKAPFLSEDDPSGNELLLVVLCEWNENQFYPTVQRLQSLHTAAWCVQFVNFPLRMWLWCNVFKSISTKKMQRAPSHILFMTLLSWPHDVLFWVKWHHPCHLLSKSTFPMKKSKELTIFLPILHVLFTFRNADYGKMFAVYYKQL